MPNKTRDIIFFEKYLRNASNNKHFASDLPTRADTELFLEERISKREQCAIETLINNSLAEEGVFHRLNERFVSNKTRYIFLTRELEL